MILSRLHGTFVVVTSACVLLSTPISTVGHGATHVNPVAASVPVQGLTTDWKLTLLRAVAVDRIPGTSSPLYHAKNQFFQFFVLTLRMTNVGHHAASLHGDLLLALRVVPPYHTQYPSGFAEASFADPPMHRLIVGAARYDGGIISTTLTPPGQTAIYSLLVAAPHGEAHYGLYNALPNAGYTLLVRDTGL